MPEWRIQTGRPAPLGATPAGDGVNFALASGNATRVELCLFDAAGRRETARLTLPERTGHIFHGHVPGLHPGQAYGYRVHGPYAPEAGHRFNPYKLLLDPYARAYLGALTWHPACYGYTLGAKDADLSFDTRDSAAYVPKCVVTAPKPAPPPGPRTPWAQTIIYEAHTRGLTKLHPGIPAALRGSYAGLGEPALIQHLQNLGVTALELLPIQFFADDAPLIERGLRNYWGYNTLGFFAADPRYAANPVHTQDEFRAMAARLHAAGLELILDTVYNHTAEGNELGPTLSFRGIDNAAYYHLVPGQARHYVNHSGTGNTLNLSNPLTRNLVLDSLRHWATEMGADGFRFDLASILARGPDGFDPAHLFLTACAADPVLATKKLIAEPWDCGPGGYQLGNFPPGWAEWNGKFRDDVRDFWRGAGTAANLATRLHGSADLFPPDRRAATESINFITAHDGFTLNDWASYDTKHNAANGEDNQDGADDNRSCNHGAEGPSADPAITTLRARQMRNMLATLILARGTPMLLAGDEFARTQHGNNNAYCQDNELSWTTWPASLTPQTSFTARLTALRQKFPALQDAEITWLGADGQELSGPAWENSSKLTLGMWLPASGLLLLCHAGDIAADFRLPPGIWHALLDTAEPDRDAATGHFTLTAKSLVLLQAG